MREKILVLRNLDYELELFNSRKRFAVYKNDEHNNIIIYSYDKGCSVDSVSGAIRDKAYDYLINVLNTENNILVDWSQVEGTTSDYSLYYDIDYNKALSSIKDKTIDDYLDSLIVTNLAPHYKYTQIKNGVNANIIPILED
jgi:hypothetical protein